MKARTQWYLWAIVVWSLPVGLQALFMPKWFFDEFPFGRSWLAAGGDPYNQHLVTDVGALYLALVVVTVWAAWRREAQQVVAVAWLIQGGAHLLFHATHLDGLANGDRAGLLVSLAGVPVLAALALWPTRGASTHQTRRHPTVTRSETP